MHFLDERHIFIFLVQVFVLLLLARGFGEVLRRFKQPVLTAEILVGVVLGPTILGRLLPGVHAALFPADAVQQSMLETVAWIGILFLLLETGLEIDFSIAWRRRGSALTIALSDIAIPMVVAFVPALLIPEAYLAHPERRLIFALFMATVMTISAMPVAARVLHDLNLLKTDLGYLTMSALAANDVIGWVLFTIILGVFTRSTAAVGPVLFVFATTVGFAVLALTLGRRLATPGLERLQRLGMPEPGASLTATCLLGLLFGAFTHRLGIHALFGFFIGGVVVGEAKTLSEESRGVISQMVHALFVPLFFANIGLKVDFAAGFNIWLVALVSAVGIAGRYLGAWVGVTMTSVPRVNRSLISIAHTPGGMMEVVVALLALESGLITQEIFVAIVFGAVLSSAAMGVWMRAALARRAAVTVGEFLRREAVVATLAATEREAAIRELAAAAAGPARDDLAREVSDAALAREREFGTALGSGVAIPHARVSTLANPVLAFGRAPEGLEWDAPDGAPVRFVFLLVIPAGAADLHVQILSRIAGVMQRSANRALLDDAGDAAALYDTLARLLSAGPAAPPPRRRREAGGGETRNAR